MIHPCASSETWYFHRPQVPPKSDQAQWRSTERSGNETLRRSLVPARRLVGPNCEFHRAERGLLALPVGASRCPLCRGRRGPDLVVLRSGATAGRGRTRRAGWPSPAAGGGGFEPDSFWGAARTSSAAASVKRASSSTTDRASESTSGTTAGQALRPTNSESR